MNSDFLRKVQTLSATVLIFVSLFSTVSSSAVYGEEVSQPAETVSMQPGDEPTATEVAAEPVATTAPGNVTIDFKEADIQNVIRILSLKSGVNIVAGKDVTGLVTIRLVDVPWEKALDVVLKTYGYAYDRDGNIIRITTIENLKKEELSTEVYSLNYATAQQVEESVRNVLSERGTVRADTRSNTIVVTDMATTLQRVEVVIAKLDRATPQVVIHAKVIEATLGDAERLGIKWNVKAKVVGSARPTTLPFQSLTQDMLEKYLPDGKAPTTGTDSIGTSGATTSTTESEFPTRTPQPTFPVAERVDFTFGTLDFSEFQAVLEAISERQDAKVLSEPHVTTLNNQEAKILVGEVIAIPIFERNSTTGRMEITGYQDRDLGVRLSVIPQVNHQNEIVVDVHPEITNLLGYDDLTPDIKAPRFSTREAKTQVRIKSGQTIAIGGLIRETTVDLVTKVPILGDLPLLGQAFTHKDKTVQKTDLLFFLTVNIVNDAALPQGHAG